MGLRSCCVAPGAQLTRPMHNPRQRDRRPRRANLLDLSIEDLAKVQVTSVSRKAERLADARGLGLRDHRRRHPAFGRDEHRGSLAPGAEPAGRAHRRQPIRDQRARLQQLDRQQAARADGRAQPLHAAVLGRVLGRAGHAARGHRTHRGDQRARRDAVGSERGQRRDQHHHAQCARHRRRAAVGLRRQPGARRGGARRAARLGTAGPGAPTPSTSTATPRKRRPARRCATRGISARPAFAPTARWALAADMAGRCLRRAHRSGVAGPQAHQRAQPARPLEPRARRRRPACRCSSTTTTRGATIPVPSPSAATPGISRRSITSCRSPGTSWCGAAALRSSSDR